MKALFAVIFCAVARVVVGGAVSWPGGVVALSSPLVNTLVHPSTKSFAYSTTQYINALPASYSYGIRPQLTYPYPQVPGFAQLPGLPAYYPISSASYIPASSIIYPQLSPIAPVQPAPSPPSTPIAPISPIAPSAPSPPQQPNRPSLPSDQTNGDADTTVIESAEFLKSQQGQQQTPKSDNANKSESTNRVSANTDKDKQPKEQVNPLYRNPQIAQLASFAPIPQLPPGIPQYSQFPQRNPFLQLPELPSLPQLPEFPQLPDLPQLPQLPQFPPSQSSPPQPPQSPSVPQFPSIQGEPSQQQPQLPQLPQFPSSPQLPQLPSFPQFPPSQGSSSSQQSPQLPTFPQFPQPQLPGFPSADNSSKGLNDEDTISVESA